MFQLILRLCHYAILVKRKKIEWGGTKGCQWCYRLISASRLLLIRTNRCHTSQIEKMDGGHRDRFQFSYSVADTITRKIIQQVLQISNMLERLESAGLTWLTRSKIFVNISPALQTDLIGLAVPLQFTSLISNGILIYIWGKSSHLRWKKDSEKLWARERKRPLAISHQFPFGPSSSATPPSE